MKSNRRVLSVFLAISLVVTAWFSVFSFCVTAQESLTVQAGNASAVVGEQVVVPVTVSGNSNGLHGMQFRVSYDSTALSLVDASVKLSGGYQAVKEEDSLVEFYWSAIDGTVQDGTTVVQLTFQVLKRGSHSVVPTVNASLGDCFYYLDETDTPVDYALSLETGTVTGEADISTVFHFEIAGRETGVHELAAADIKMCKAEAIYGFSIEVNYDAEKLSFESGTLNERFPYGRIVCHEPGTVRIFACTEVASPVTGDADMASLYFNVLDPNADTGTSYDLSVTYYNGQPAYTLDAQKHTVDITDVPAVCTPIVLTATNPYDLNGDSVVNITDVAVLLDCLAGAGTANGADTDLNGDGTTNITDVAALLDWLAGV